METETVIQYRFMRGEAGSTEWQDLRGEIILPELSDLYMNGVPFIQTRAITREKPKPVVKKVCGAESPFEMDDDNLRCEGLEHGPELRHQHYYLAEEHGASSDLCGHRFYWD